jgi:hypothetical protein
MEIVTAPAGLAEGVEIASKYRLGTRLAATARQTDFETIYRGSVARIRIFRCDTVGEASELAAGFALAFQLPHPNLMAVYDFGQDVLDGEHLAWITMERGDECLGEILGGRTLQEEEVRQLLGGILPPLEFLNDRKLGHADLRAASVFACGDEIKLSPDRLSATASLTTDAQVSRLILETLTGSQDESKAAILNSPLRELATPRLDRTLAEIKAALEGKAVVSEPPAQLAVSEVQTPEQPTYRKYAGLAMTGVLAAAALCAFLIRGAHQTTSISTAQTVVVSAPSLTSAQAAPANSHAPIPRGWAIVTLSFKQAADADKRAAEILATHPALEAKVYSADKAGRHFVIAFAFGLTEPQAKKQLTRDRRNGAPRGTHIARYD